MESSGIVSDISWKAPVKRTGAFCMHREIKLEMNVYLQKKQNVV